jgi:uncharacterized protein YodC (DUF2158 family)
MEEIKFKKDDPVRHRLGIGPKPMYVVKTGAVIQTPFVECQYYDAGEFRTARFHPDDLVLITSGRSFQPDEDL